jgi:hypothetical protein
MKHFCLAYYNEKKFEALPKTELDALVSACKSQMRNFTITAT